MTFEREGVVFELGDEARVAAIAAEITRHERPGCEGLASDGSPRPPCRRLQHVVGCVRDRCVCVLGIVECRCCATYGLNVAGGGKSRYPADAASGHVRLMTAAEFVLLARAVAA